MPPAIKPIPVGQDPTELEAWDAFLVTHHPHISRHAAMRAGLRLAIGILQDEPERLVPHLARLRFTRGKARKNQTP